MGGFKVPQSRTLAKLLAVIGTAIAAMALLAPAASATEPKENYKQFAGCPAPGEIPGVTSFVCFRSVVDGGHFQMGNKTVPIENPITLSGGITETESVVANAKGGLTPVKQKVPGGVVGLTGLTFLLELFGVEALTLYATTELAGVPSNPLEFPVSLPIKVHLTNPVGLLGKSCYIGSVSNPIKLSLTTETTEPPPPNKPITGVFPKIVEDPVLQIAHLNNGTFVDNAFAAPGASGCVLTLFGFIPISINGLVNAQSGLPSPAGTNETVQEFDAEFTLASHVY